jgi:hypothetical protein
MKILAENFTEITSTGEKTMKTTITLSNKKTGTEYSISVIQKNNESNEQLAIRAAKKEFGNSAKIDFSGRTMSIENSESTKFYGDFWVYKNGQQLA